MNLDRARGLGQEIVAFLKDALAEQVPDRDVPRSEAIQQEILEALPDGRSEAEWLAWREVLAEPIIEAFAETEERWDPAIDRVELYFHHVWSSALHSRWDERSTRRKPDGVAFHPIPMDLGHLVLRGFFQENPYRRLSFFEHIESWNALFALEHLIPELEMDAREALALVRCIDERFPHNDGARDGALEAARTWIKAHPAIGREIVDAWLEKQPWSHGLKPSALYDLVEEVVHAVHAGPEQVAWREEVLTKLKLERDERLWELLPGLACFAWPAPMPPARERHDRMMEEVRWLPQQMRSTAFGALIRDASEWPVESVETAVRLLELLDERTRAAPNAMLRVALSVADITRRALQAARSKGIQIAKIEALLLHLLILPPERAKWHLDRALMELRRIDEPMAFDFGARWISSHIKELHEAVLLFDDVFSALAGDLKPEGVTRWLLRWMVHADATTRRAAAGLLGRARRVHLPAGLLESFSPNEVDALAHELFGTGIDPSASVPLLIAIAVRRPDGMKVVRQILLEEVAEDYPDACRKALQQAFLPEDSTNEPFADLRRVVLDRLDQADASYEQARRVPDLLALRPGRRAWHEMQNRVFQEYEREARTSGRTLLSLVTSIPIARGEATDPQEGGDPTGFAQYSTTIELPRREILDPLGFRSRRLLHRNQAEKLLAQKGPAS